MLKIPQGVYSDSGNGNGNCDSTAAQEVWSSVPERKWKLPFQALGLEYPGILEKYLVIMEKTIKTTIWDLGLLHEDFGFPGAGREWTRLAIQMQSPYIPPS